MDITIINLFIRFLNGNFEIDYFNLRHDALMGKAPYMTREEFAKTYYNYGY